jgi:hypothetical protein
MRLRGSFFVVHQLQAEHDHSLYIIIHVLACVILITAEDDGGKVRTLFRRYEARVSRGSLSNEPVA